ncbi:electron transport complex subunit RsxG [Dechloromonas sp. A34]|uniref:electron transport complex subunit RsxG n=1 Tax=Dechloromonas sp. A34 TaxID=447588 RepID=UPI0022489F42|nr:electron transport complex subunit RsxG [Dechloromonas sp. A34]
MNFESFREKIGYQPVLLGTIALLASGALALASSATSEAIAAAEAKDLRDSLSEVLPQGMADNDFLKDTVELQKDGKTVTIYRARQGETVKAALFKVAERGYAGDIQVLMAVDLEGRTLGVRVLKHVETPGLGDKIEVKKDAWIKSFDGKSLGEPTPDKWGVKKDNGIFDQFAGATITPRAVVKAVKGGLEFFAAHKSEITG